MPPESIKEEKAVYSWSNYLICLSPLVLILYISSETYAIDYRSFYLAGKSFLSGLNPYLNYIHLSSDFYGPVNSELYYYSGWKYPPIATYLFAPFATLPYEISKNIFNLFTVFIGLISLFKFIKASGRSITPESILIVGISFPLLATISRGQIDIILVCFSVYACYLFNQGYLLRSSALISFLSFIKIFPIIIIINFLGKQKRSKSFMIFFFTFVLILILITLLFCPFEWISSFLERVTIPWNDIPAGSLNSLPENVGIIPDTMIVQTSDAKNLFHSHYFVFGFANPLLQKNITLSALFGFAGSIICLLKYKRNSFYLQCFAVMNWINIINPISWIMGLSWYIPLFLFSYNSIKSKYKFLICLPLILPPFLNVSGYLAALISLIITNLYQTKKLT